MDIDITTKGPYFLLVAEGPTWKESVRADGDTLNDMHAALINMAVKWQSSKKGRTSRATMQAGIVGLWLYYSDGKPRCFCYVETGPKFREPHPGDILVDRPGVK
jgi:hypothetical protein